MRTSAWQISLALPAILKTLHHSRCSKDAHCVLALFTSHLALSAPRLAILQQNDTAAPPSLPGYHAPLDRRSNSSPLYLLHSAIPRQWFFSSQAQFDELVYSSGLQVVQQPPTTAQCGSACTSAVYGDRSGECGRCDSKAFTRA